MSPRIKNEASVGENERVSVAQRKNKIVGSKVSSIKPGTEPISRSEENRQWINRRLLSATSAALSRLKVQLRSGKKGGRTLHSRSSREVSDQGASTGDLNVDDHPKHKRDDGKITLSAIFDDETESDVFDTKMSTPPPKKDEQECSSPRSVSASMLMPSTLDRDRKKVTGKTETRDPFELLPRLDQAASDQVRKAGLFVLSSAEVASSAIHIDCVLYLYYTSCSILNQTGIKSYYKYR